MLPPATLKDLDPDAVAATLLGALILMGMQLVINLAQFFEGKFSSQPPETRILVDPDYKQTHMKLIEEQDEGPPKHEYWKRCQQNSMENAPFQYALYVMVAMTGANQSPAVTYGGLIFALSRIVYVMLYHIQGRFVTPGSLLGFTRSVWYICTHIFSLYVGISTVSQVYSN